MIEQTSWFQLQPLYRYIRQQSENRRFFKYIEIGSTFFLIAIFLFFAIMPTATAISALIGEIKSKETLSSAMSSKISSIMAAQESFSQIQSDYSILESSYPILPNFYKSASNFSYISKESSTPIKTLGFQINQENNKEKNASDSTFGVNISAIGQYSSLVASVDKISKIRRLVDIKSIQISQVDDKDKNVQSSQLNLNVSANLYYLPQNYDQK